MPFLTVIAVISPEPDDFELTPGLSASVRQLHALKYEISSARREPDTVILPVITTLADSLRRYFTL